MGLIIPTHHLEKQLPSDANGILDTILFLIVGIDFAVLWGILAFLLSFIPTIGFWLAAIPPTFLALLEFGPVTAVVVFLLIVLINGFAENVVPSNRCFRNSTSATSK